MIIIIAAPRTRRSLVRVAARPDPAHPSPPCRIPLLPHSPALWASGSVSGGGGGGSDGGGGGGWWGGRGLARTQPRGTVCRPAPPRPTSTPTRVHPFMLLHSAMQLKLPACKTPPPLPNPTPPRARAKAATRIFAAVRGVSLSCDPPPPPPPGAAGAAQRRRRRSVGTFLRRSS